MIPRPLVALLMFALSPSASSQSEATPLLEVASGLPGKQVRLSWSSETGTRYRIERSTTLDVWSQIALVEAATAQTTWLDPEPTGQKAFYRVSKPEPEVFSVSPPVLSPVGGVLLIRGQAIPAGSFLVLNVDGQLVQVPLSGAAGGAWNAVVTGQFAPGASVTAVEIVDGTGATLVSLNQPLTVTETGRALDGFATLPPGAAVAMDAAKKIPGIGVVVKKNPGSGAERTAGRKKFPPSLYAHNLMQRLQLPVKGIPPIVKSSGEVKWVGVGRGMGPSPDDDGIVSDGDDSNASKKGYDDYGNSGDLPSARKKLANDKHPELMRAAASNPFFQNEGIPGSMPLDAIRGKVKDIRQMGDRCSGIPGEITVEASVLSLETPAGPALQVVHSYRSIGGSGTAGSHWEMCYDISAETIPAGAGSEAARVKIFDGAGRCDVFQRQVDGSYRCDGLFREGRFTGNVFTLTFADKGRWVFRPFGRVQAAGKISTITDRNGVSISCDYDGAGSLATVSSRFGQSVSFTRGPDGKISRVTDQTGRYVSYGYFGPGDPNGNEGDLASISCPLMDGTPPAAGPTTFTYTTGYPDGNLNGNVLSVTDGAGRLVESFTYSAETDPLSIDYDKCASSNKTGHVSICKREIRPPGTSPEGGYTVFENDEVGRLTETVYDRMHRPVSERRYTGFCTPGLAVTSSSNRPTGRLRATDPEFFETTCSYNSDSLCTLLTHPDGSQEIATYDRDFRRNCPVREGGNPRQMTLRTPSGETRTISCDYLPGFGTFEKVTNKGVVTGSIIISCADRNANGVGADSGDDCPRVRMVSAHGQVTVCSYDPDGNLLSVSSPVPGRGSLYEYNTLGQLTSATTLNGLGSSFTDACTYDPASNFLRSVVCDSGGLNLTTTCDRDPLGRITRVIDPRGNDELYTYNALDQIAEIQSAPVPERIRTSFHCDAAGQLARCDVEHRDSNGVLVSANPAYSSFFVYDDHGLLIRTAEEERPVDGSGTLDPATLGIENFAVCDITLNDAGECTRLSIPAACRAQADDLVCDFTYDERGFLHLTHEGGEGNPDGLVTSRDYHLFGAIPQRRTISGQGITTVESCTYDGFHRLSSETDPMGNVCTYEYDNKGYVTCSVYGEVNDVPGSENNVLLARRLITVKIQKPRTMCEESSYVSYDGPGAGPHVRLLLPAVQKLRDVIRKYHGKPISVKAYSLVSAARVGEGPGRTPSFAFKPNSFDTPFFSFETEDETVTDDRFTPGGAITQEITTIDRSPAGLVQQISCNGDMLATFSYDSASRLTGRISGDTSHFFTLNPNGDVTSSTRTDTCPSDPTQTKTFTVSHIIDAAGRITQNTDGTGNVSFSAYDSLDRPVSFTEPGGLVTRCAYDGGTPAGPFSEQVSTDALTPSTFVVVSSSLVRSGELRSTTDSYGYKITTSADKLGRMTRCDYPDGTSETRGYSHVNLGPIKHVDHGRTTMTRDLNGQPLTSLTTSDPLIAPISSTPERTFTYNGLGQCTSVTQGVHIVAYSYDSLGNLLSETQDGRTVSRTFSHRGRTSITYPTGQTFAEDRDALGKLLSVSALPALVPPSLPVVVHRYAGQRIISSTQGNGIVTSYQYRGDGEAALGIGPDFTFDDLVRQTVSNGIQFLHKEHIIHRDLAARVIREDHLFAAGAAPPSRSKTFVRNRQGHTIFCTTRRRPTAGAQPIIESEVSYTRDLEGRRLSANGGENPGLYTQASALPPGDQQMGQYSTWPRGPLGWDDNGNLVSMATASGTLSLVHDVEGRLTSVSRNGVPVISYVYDPIGRCISRDPEVGPATIFVYDGDICIQEFGEDGLPDLTHVYADGIDQSISTRGGSRFYLHKSLDCAVSRWKAPESNSNSDRVSLITDTAGVVLERYDCDDAGKPVFLNPAGLPTSATQSTIPLRWMAPGSSWESEIGMFQCPGRFYSPALRTDVSSSKIAYGLRNPYKLQRRPLTNE